MSSKQSSKSKQKEEPSSAQRPPSNLGANPRKKASNEFESDPRFAKALSDPRFQKQNKRDKKVVVDSRFAAMFTNKDFQKQGTVDKYGRAIEKSENLAAYYELDNRTSTKISKGAKDSLKKQNKAEKLKTPLSKSETDDTEDNIGSEEEKEYVEQSYDEEYENDDQDENDGKIEEEEEEEEEEDGEDSEDDGRENSENDEDDANSTDTDDITSESGQENGESEGDEEDIWGNVQNEVIPIAEETRRIAIMNLDWARIRAIDLLVLFQSMSPPGGLIKSVGIHPSDFGIEQMQKEQTEGPAGIWKEEKGTSSKKIEAKPLDLDENIEDSIDPNKLRKYELNRLKYYYGVIECDSAKTALVIYNECDGLEYEKTGNILDLRFIPDELEIPHPPKDKAVEIPQKYKPPEFATAALQSSNVKLTWDETDFKRLKVTTRKFSKKDLKEMDFEDYLASDGDDEDDDDDTYNGAATRSKEGDDTDQKVEHNHDEANIDGQKKNIEKASLEGKGKK